MPGTVPRAACAVPETCDAAAQVLLDDMDAGAHKVSNHVQVMLAGIGGTGSADAPPMDAASAQEMALFFDDLAQSDGKSSW